MSDRTKKWELLNKSKPKSDKEILEVLLRNRGIKTEREKKEFFNPTSPMEIKAGEVGLSEKEIEIAIKRIKLAKKNNEHVIIYGDYDADGITGTATLWEAIHSLGIFVLPHIPERFSEGYGLNLESVKTLKEKDPELALIITVDHGITAGEKVMELKKMGIDMIITDHHQAGKTKPRPEALIYTTEIGGSAVAWFFAREVTNNFKIKNSKFKIDERLQLAAIGTVADQLPLSGPNRSIVKFGLEELNRTKRPGILALFEEARIKEAGPYEIGFVIAPRINAMGRLKHGLESLRLLCTTDKVRALQIAGEIGRTNSDRQKIVEEVVKHARDSYRELEKRFVIVLAHESYHEGVIGLAAAKLVEEFGIPAIVLSKKGKIAKASARSIPGFNIIEAIRKLEDLYLEGGGHPMAAGFSIDIEKIEEFTNKLNEIAKKEITEELMQKKLKIDTEIDFPAITEILYKQIKNFEPTGIGNPAPVFSSEDVEIVSAKTVGQTKNHIKLKLKQDDHIFDSIFFGGGILYPDLKSGILCKICYQIDENIWNDNVSLQLKIKDIQLI